MKAGKCVNPRDHPHVFLIQELLLVSHIHSLVVIKERSSALFLSA
jgi:hypothetical protein